MRTNIHAGPEADLASLVGSGGVVVCVLNICRGHVIGMLRRAHGVPIPDTAPQSEVMYPSKLHSPRATSVINQPSAQLGTPFTWRTCSQ